eukprot:scaffold2188_cov102-Isochrysis_galbana.AAC.19
MPDSNPALPPLLSLPPPKPLFLKKLSSPPAHPKEEPIIHKSSNLQSSIFKAFKLQTPWGHSGLTVGGSPTRGGDGR